ncbi:nitrile hydratase subunit beta [Alphaproteobacteria bacterium]|jgi:nitrile hydratase|nr:nitrile hydratase subunit beta [Alphaproteobacteria bacterium]
MSSSFSAGEIVQVSNLYPKTHHRVPKYLKGKIGQVETYLGEFESAENLSYFQFDKDKQELYRVRFTHACLWGGAQSDEVFADLAAPWLRLVDTKK